MKAKKTILRLSLTGALVFAATSLLQVTGILTPAEHRAYDHRMAATSEAFAPSERIALILLDQESLDWAKREKHWGWPWPRESYGKLIDFFNRAGAAAVAFDMLYTEPSVYGADDDQAFADACARYGRVVQTVYYGGSGGSVAGSAPANGSAGGAASSGKSPLAKATSPAVRDESPNSTNSPLLPVSPIAESAAIIGNITSTLDSDGSARRSGFYAATAKAEPGLAIAALTLTGEMPSLDDIPQARLGGMYLRYQKDLTRFAPYTASQILISEEAIEEAEAAGRAPDFSGDILNPADFKDMYVFFGLYAPGLFDICTTPVSAVYPGVGVHLSQLDTILEGKYLWDSPLWLIFLLIFAGSVIGCLLGSLSKQVRTRTIVLETVTFIAVCLLYTAVTYIAFIKGVILPFTAPLLAQILAFAVSITESYLSEGRQRRYLKSAFRQYLSPAVIDNLIENPSLLKLGGERREITAYFSDIQGFTTISEGLSPEGLTQFLNTYLSAMSDIILAHGGTIDKYEGDAIIAFWNAPTYQDDHAKRGLEAALECQKHLAEMQEELTAITGRPVLQRIGLNTGTATVGNFGSNKRFDYTMMGDTVNLASRLEGINKQFGTYTMCSETTMQRALEQGCKLAFRNIANIAVVGRKEPVKVFTPMTAEEKAQKASDFAPFEKAYPLFVAGDFKAAREAFAQGSATDPVCQKYLEKCDRFIATPPETWQGFLHATEK